MSDYTPTTEEVREAVAEWMWSRRMFRTDLSVSDGSEVDCWLAAHDAEIRADAWDEGARSRQCHCAAWNEDECGCGNYPSEPNPYRTPRPPAPELFPGVQERLDALSIRKEKP